MTERTVLTTGANSGIGLATVLAVAQAGFRSVGSVRSEAKAEQVREAAADAGVDVETVILDVTDPEQCQRAVAGFHLWGLVNNAGYGLLGAVEDVSDEEAHRLFETMVHAPVRLARLALPQLREAKGRIVNVSSIAGLTTAPFAGHYSAAKHALEALSDALRMEVAGDGVKVVLVEPGGFRTNIWDDLEADLRAREAQGSRYVDAYRRSVRGERILEPLFGEPDGVARVIVRALTAKVPRPRYLVGADAQLLRAADRFTPTVVKDVAVRLGLGL